MALYNTLFSFPVTIAHGSDVIGGTGTKALSLSLDTLTRWYWRVRRWEMVIAMNGASITGYFEQAHVYDEHGAGTSITDETGLLFPCSLYLVGGTASFTTSDITGDMVLWLFTDGLATTAYDPATLTYPWAGVAGVLQLLSGPSRLAVSFQPGTQPSGAGYLAIDMPVTIDGMSCTIPGVAHDPGGGTPSAPTTSCTITPAEFWSWGGKYDTTTGALL